MFDAVIVGAGACGLMCGVQAAALGKKVLILEKNSKAGAKILISGGGRCNYTNLYSAADNFISSDPEFCRPVFDEWTVADTIRFFEEGGISGKEKTLGQLFPVSNNAKDVVDVFLNLLRKAGARLTLNATVTRVERMGVHFEVEYEQDGKLYNEQTAAIVMSSGGLPISKMGATDFSLRVARQFGLKVESTAPALVPLTVTGKDAEWFSALSGNAVLAEVWNARIRFRENILFTHWGLSGPAILKLSARCARELAERDYRFDIRIHWCGAIPLERLETMLVEARESAPKRLVRNGLPGLSGPGLPARLWQRLVEVVGIPAEVTWSNLTREARQRLAAELTAGRFQVRGQSLNKDEFVTAGGVALKEIDFKTMESRRCPGLYFAGEVMDIDGVTGGFNFQSAWTTGWIAGESAAAVFATGGGEEVATG